MSVLSQMRQRLHWLQMRVLRQHGKNFHDQQLSDYKHLVQTFGRLSDAEICSRTGKLLAFYKPQQPNH